MDAVKPVLVYEVVVEVAICAKLLQPLPEQRSIRYWLIVPPVSVAAVQVRAIWVPDALAVRFDGAVNVGAEVLVVATDEYGPVTLLVSDARTR